MALIVWGSFRLLLELAKVYNFNSGGVHFGNTIILVDCEMCAHLAETLLFLMQIYTRRLLRRLLFPRLVGVLGNGVRPDGLVVGLHELIFVLETVVCGCREVLLLMLRDLVAILVVDLLDSALELLAEVLRFLEDLLDRGVVDLEVGLRGSEVRQGRRLLHANSHLHVRIWVDALLPIIRIFILRSRAIKSGLPLPTPTVFHESAIILQLVLERGDLRLLHHLVLVV